MRKKKQFIPFDQKQFKNSQENVEKSEEKMKGKNSAFGLGLRFLLFKKSMVFLLKNYKKKSRNFFIVYCTSLVWIALENPACAKSFTQMLGWARWDGVGNLLFLLPVLIWGCIFVPLPILWGFHNIRDRKLKKMIQKLEKTTEPQDEEDRG